VILGPLFDETFRRSLLISDGDLSTFWTRPGAAILLGLNVALILSQLPIIKRLFKRTKPGEAA
jgi:putative tricarboxylic transport membrane protein